MADKIFRDPLYNYICIDKSRDGWLIDLLSTPEVQRLRRIHQLGVSNLTYSGADHNRLAHSMGVLHLMQQVLNHLERTSDAEKIKTARMRLLAASLLHDVGHGPFSHLFEPCLNIKHEAWSVQAVRDESCQIHQILRKQDGYLPEAVADLITEKSTKPPPWQKALLSSQLDVDRLDYLRRDSLFTGAGYGHFDWFRLLTTIEFHDGDDLIWPEKSALAIEEYIFSRFYMYRNVYHHKTTRGFEQILQAMWRRAGELRTAGSDVKPVPVLKEFWKVDQPSPAKLPMRAYLDVEEFVVLSQIHTWKNHRDKALADLARRFLDRDGLAMIEPPPPADPLTNDYSEWEAAVKEVLGKAGYSAPEAYCLRDTVVGKYLQPYKPEQGMDLQTAANSIRIDVPGCRPIEVSEYLPRLGAVTKLPPDQVRYYVPQEVRSQVQKLTKEWHASAPASSAAALPSGGAASVASPRSRSARSGAAPRARRRARRSNRSAQGKRKRS